MDVERDGKLIFLVVEIIREGPRSGHTLYRKPTRTDRYKKQCNHHPCQKSGLTRTLSQTVRNICRSGYPSRELWCFRGSYKN